MTQSDITIISPDERARRPLKHSGIEWIGDIPEDWGMRKIKHVFTLLDGSGFPESIQGSLRGDYPFCKVSDINGSGKTVSSANNFVHKNWVTNNKISIIPANSILAAKIGAALWKNHRKVNSVECCIDNNMMAFVPNRMLIDNEFSYWLLSSIDLSWFDNRGTIPCVNKSELRDACIPLPPLPEQERIAAYLDEKCTKIDALVANSKARLEVLDEYRKTLIAKAVTKGLDEGVALKNSGIEWIGEIPEEWGVVPNKYLMKKVKEIIPRFNGEPILSLTMEGVIERDLEAGGKIPASFDGYQKINAGNLLMCLFDVDVTPRCIGLITQDGITSPAYSQFTLIDGCDSSYYYYLYLFLDNDKILLPQAKNLRHSLTEDVLGEIPMILPPLSEQERIAAYLDEKCAHIDTLKASIAQKLEALAKYKQSLIFEYVTGKREVPACFGGEDSND